MKKMTEDNLKNAFAGESQAHLKYLSFADKAAAESLPNVARLFKAASFSEQVHAANHLKTLSGIGKTSENLAGAMAGENFEVAEMYDAYMAVADRQGEKQAKMMFHAASEAEKVHSGLYARAKEAVDKGKDADLRAVQVCSMCGFTVEGDAPDKCPICGAPKQKFVKF
jgi:rubrerythrin